MAEHPVLWLVFCFVFGSIVGSFLNVCIYRLPRGGSVFYPTWSYCPQCHQTIAWYDNIPVFSYFMLGRQCRHCGGIISPRYALIELLTACLLTLMLYVLWRRGETLGVIAVYGALACALIVASFIDLELRIIPDSITLGGTLIAALLCVLVPEVHINPHGVSMGRGLLFSRSPALGSLGAWAVGAGVGVLLTWATGVMGKAVFRREAMGLGDVKLMALIGGLLGWKLILIVFFVAPVFGAVIGVFMLIRTRDHHIPYGPFLSLAAIVVMLFGDTIIRLVFRM